MQSTIKFFIQPYCGFSRSTWKFLATGFINAIGLTFTVYLTLYLNLLDYSVSKIGIIITLFSIGSLLGGYFGGRFSDKYSSLAICKFSLLLSSIILFSIPLSQNYYLLGITVTAFGLISSLFRPAFILALTDKTDENNLERIIALRRVAINLGMAFGATFLGFIASTQFHILFFTIAIANLLAFIILIGVTDTNNSIKISETKTFPDVIISKNFYFILILMFFITVIFNQTQTTYPLFLKNNNQASVKFISFIFTLNGFLIVLLQMPITSYLSRFNVNLTCAIGTLLLTFGLSLLPFFSSQIAIIISCIIWTLGEIIVFPSLLALVIKFSGNKKGKNIGMYQFFFSLASFAAPAIGIFCYGYNANLIWQVSTFLGLAITFYFLFSIKIPKKNFIEFPILEKGK